MKLFFLYVLGSFIYGVVGARHPRKKKLIYILGFGLIVCFGYYFLNMI